LFLSNEDKSLNDEHELYDLIDDDEVQFEDGIEHDPELVDEYDDVADEYDKLNDSISSDESLLIYDDINDYDDDDD